MSVAMSTATSHAFPKLYIGNLGQNTKSSLNEIFGKFGRITSIYLCKEKRFAFVDYESYESGKNAIAELNEKSPYKLKVRWANQKMNGHDNNIKKKEPENKQDLSKSMNSSSKSMSSTISETCEQKNTNSDVDRQTLKINHIKNFCENIKSTDTCFCRRSRNLDAEFLKNCKDQIIFKVKANQCQLCSKEWSAISLYNFTHLDYTCECLYLKENVAPSDSLQRRDIYRFAAQYSIEGKDMNVTEIKKLSSNKWLCLSINENTIDSYNSLCTSFGDDCQKYPKTKGDVNEKYVALDVKDGTGWFRAMRISNDKFALIDEGRILQRSEINSVIPIPEKYNKIPAFCLVMTIMSQISNFKLGGRNVRVVYNDSSDTVNITFKENDETHYAFLTHWKPSEDLDVSIHAEETVKTSAVKSNIFPDSSIKPKTGDVVIMTHYCHGQEIYLRLGDKKGKKDYTLLLNTIAIEAQDASNLHKPLKPREAAFHLKEIEDETEYSRVLVTSQNDDKTYDVICLETGIVTRVTSSDLKEITEKAKNLPMKLKKERLANVSSDLPTLGVMKYVNKLIEREAALICSYEPSGELVLNIELSTENVNTEITKLMVPLYDQLKEKNVNIFDEPILLDHHITPLSFEKVMQSRKPFKLLVLDTTMIAKNIVNCTLTDEDLQRKFRILKAEIDQYCSQQKMDYLPRPRELCLALYNDGEYYRACVHKVNGDEVTVTFIDYGNIETLPRTSIKKMLSYFIDDVPQLANPCILTGLPNNCSEKVLKRATTILTSDAITVTSMKLVDNVYSIFVPDLINTLRKEKLIPQ